MLEKEECNWCKYKRIPQYFGASPRCIHPHRDMYDTYITPTTISFRVPCDFFKGGPGDAVARLAET